MKFRVGDTVLVTEGICKGYRGRLTKIDEQYGETRLWAYWIDKNGIQGKYEGWIPKSKDIVLVGGRKDFIDGKRLTK